MVFDCTRGSLGDVNDRKLDVERRLHVPYLLIDGKLACEGEFKVYMTPGILLWKATLYSDGSTWLHIFMNEDDVIHVVGLLQPK